MFYLRCERLITFAVRIRDLVVLMSNAYSFGTLVSILT